MESVITFKETFPDFREISHGFDYEFEYILQSRNMNTGNILSLLIFYDYYDFNMNPDFFNVNVNLVCILKVDHGYEEMDFWDMSYPETTVREIIVMKITDPYTYNLFVHEEIKTTDCLDDDVRTIIKDEIKPEIVLR